MTKGAVFVLSAVFRGYSAFALAVIVFCASCSQSKLLTPKQFTREFAQALRHARPSLGVEIVRDLELKIASPAGGDSTSFLNNAYDTYKRDPNAKAEVIQRFVAAYLDTIGGTEKGVDRTRIVPVIKDRPWLDETRQTLISRGAKRVPEHVYDDFTADLVVLYAEDSPRTIRYLEPKDLEAAKIERGDLRKLACENLKRLLPKIERHGTNGVYMLTADGAYEASLLLLDSIWQDARFDVQGDIVVAVPTRDVLLVAGSRDAQGIAKLKQLVEKVSNGGAYRLTQKLFVYRNGKFAEFSGVAESGHPPGR